MLGIKSALKSSLCAIRQGSFLVPLLFLFNNDLGNFTINKPVLFADDTCFIPHNVSMQNLTFKMTNEVENLDRVKSR